MKNWLLLKVSCRRKVTLPDDRDIRILQNTLKFDQMQKL